ncbi:MAG: hypothetical protein V1792_19500 [Pseudomonadota bacterium]
MKKIILHKDRPMKHISIRVPEDVLEDLKRIAPLKGMGGYQALIKFYISQGLRKDRRELWETGHGRVEAVLAECGVNPEQRREILDRLKEEQPSSTEVSA